MANNRLAILILIVIAIAVAGIMVETYWDCRLLKGGSFKECVPPHPAPIGLH
jgi:FtsZ-interacting cell division protein ZipA